MQQQYPTQNLPHIRKPALAVGLWLLALIPALGCTQPAGPVDPTGDVPEAKGWGMETIVDGLRHPWSMAWLPDGSALVTERPGQLRLIRQATTSAAALDPTPIRGTPKVCACGQGGLLDISLHPDFADNQLVYLTFAEGTEDANRTALARGRLDLENKRLRDLEILFRNADSKSGGQHFGSRLLWLPDGTLLMSIGDGGNPPTSFDGENIRNQAQNPGTHFGSLLRLNADGSAPADNPFVDQPSAKPEIYSIGHRNIQGLTRDPDSGRIWANEHGSRGGDEINLIQAGNNYGWPEVTYSMEYWGPRVSDKTKAPGVTQPTVVWTPSIAPSGMAFYTGDDFPDWQGDLISGALKFQQLRRTELDGTRVVGEDKLSIGQRVRDVRQGPDGGLYILTDAPNGALIRIVQEAD
ncbi:PQQ-dependent sugar dehydrogenase [Lamprobacter modestohalophilus]|uniref:PQQ-dependent sugar dehydrogenase n=1 Tax=Lamprobacter modestohalophilus TaxID=1064514 RepID=UPI002ADEE8D6|nr:PQQ-dependent sugar dehydrogenase [Lamprobacter modestohalophilus]MEA1050032.1 PQQ-dependent sugar dehydrogenase [Lamprobacter modestohalophilus]